MTFRTGQFYTGRAFSTDLALTATRVHIEAARQAVKEIAEGFVKVALADLMAQTGKIVELPISEAICDTLNGTTNHVEVDVTFGNWPEDVEFGPSVWDYCESNGIEVDE